MDNREYLKKVVTELSKPLKYKWKIQGYNKDKTKAMCVAYIDARDVTHRLNEVCEYGWHREHFMLGTDIYSRVGVVLPDGSIQWRADAGESDNDFQKTKTASSDSFKRAAKEFGLGLFLYDLDIINLPVVKQGNYNNIVDSNGNKVWDLTKYINDEYNSKKPSPKPPVAKKETSKPKATPVAKVESKPEKGGAIQPNPSFEQTPEEARKAKAKAAFDKLDQAKVLKHLIKSGHKFTSAHDFINATGIDEVMKVYTELTS